MKKLYLLSVALLLVLQGQGQDRPFITTWQVTDADRSVKIIIDPAFDYNFTYSFTGANNILTGYYGAGNNGDLTVFLPAAGVYRLEITGEFPHFQLGAYFAPGTEPSDRNITKLKDVLQWGDIVWQSMRRSFMAWKGTQFSAVDVPDLSAVTDMAGMFRSATAFNGDLSSWDVSHVTNMAYMFYEAASFNGDLSSWDVSAVTSMTGMFRSASSFNQDMSRWNLNTVTDMSQMFDHSGLSPSHYDKVLIGWAAQEVRSAVKFGAAGITYCSGASARNTLVDIYGWDIIDAGMSCSNKTDILAFELPEQMNAAVIDPVMHTITVYVVVGTDLTALTPAITLSPGATISPGSGVPQDFTGPVTYMVTAEEGVTTQGWIVQASVFERKNQTIDFGELPDIILEQGVPGVIRLSATASSGLPVSFSLVSGPGILTGNIVMLSEPGEVTIAADQAGDGWFLPAPRQTRSFTIVNLADAHTATSERLTADSSFDPAVGLSIYPNPVSHRLHVDTRQEVWVHLVDKNGRQLTPAQRGTHLEVEMEGLPADIYLLMISDGKVIKTQKMIIKE